MSYSSSAARSTPLLLIVLFNAFACTRIEPAESFEQVRDSLAQRTPTMRVEWRGVTADDAAADRAVEDLFAGELTADQAVQIALLNNRNLQATYEDLGIAQADLVQAGLLHNPVFDFAVRFPTRSGEGTNIEISVVQDFLDIFFIPARKRIAADRFEAAQLRVAGAVIDLAADVRQAYYTAQGAQQRLAVRRQLSLAADAAADAARRLREAGNVTALQLATREADAAQARVELVSAEAQARVDREKLARLMGISGVESDWQIAPELPAIPEMEIALDAAESLALSQRYDIQAAQSDAMAQARAAKIADDTRFLSELQLGASGEREPEGFWVVGPTVSAPLPLFDQGQASLAAARARLRQARQQYFAALNGARADVRTAYAQLLAARARAEHFRTVVIPLRAKVFEEAQLQYHGMLIDVFELLQHRREQIEADEDYLDAVRDYWIAHAELERAAGGKLPPGSKMLPIQKPRPATAPATQPATAPAPDHRHHH